jgi:D-glycero-D-manno-heptose 1,7-bisphosphate phosphatase
MARRAVFLDRDGVVNESIVRDGKPFPPTSVRETIPVERAKESLERLKARGFLLIVVTNQPDVRRGTVRREEIEEIHGFLGQQLPLDHFFVCYHDDRDNCNCRKPRPGLLLEAARRHEVELQTSYLVGDRWRDIDAGAAAGCRTVLIDRRYNERSPTFVPNAVVSSLEEAVDWIMGQEVESY